MRPDPTTGEVRSRSPPLRRLPPPGAPPLLSTVDAKRPLAVSESVGFRPGFYVYVSTDFVCGAVFAVAQTRWCSSPGDVHGGDLESFIRGFYLRVSRQAFREWGERAPKGASRKRLKSGVNTCAKGRRGGAI